MDGEISLDQLRADEAAAYENLSQAFIQHSLAKNRVTQRLNEIREGFPTLFDN